MKNRILELLKQPIPALSIYGYLDAINEMQLLINDFYHCRKVEIEFDPGSSCISGALSKYKSLKMHVMVLYHLKDMDPVDSLCEFNIEGNEMPSTFFWNFLSNQLFAFERFCLENEEKIPGFRKIYNKFDPESF